MPLSRASLPLRSRPVSGGEPRSGYKRHVRGSLLAIGCLLLAVSIMWFAAFLATRFNRKNDIYSGTWRHLPTLEEGREQARRQEMFFRKRLPMATAAIVISLPFLIIGGLTHR
jgi:hypothetical protein